jgi:hypothetical protein
MMGQARLVTWTWKPPRKPNSINISPSVHLAEHEEAVEDFLKADATDPRAMLEIQGRAKRLDALTRWVDDAINTGYAAHQKLTQQEYVDG